MIFREFDNRTSYSVFILLEYASRGLIYVDHVQPLRSMRVGASEFTIDVALAAAASL